MTALEWLAAAGVPPIIVVLAYGAARLFFWELKRRDRMHPGE